MIPNDMSITINGLESTDLDQADALTRAVIISLFSWRRANADDATEGFKMGYWGDAIVPPAENDRIGSRLWLLSREKLLPSTFNRAREYAMEALQWFVNDGVATKVIAEAEQYGVDGLALVVTIYRVDGASAILRFNKAWEIIRAV